MTLTIRGRISSGAARSRQQRAVGAKRGIDMTGLDPEDADAVAAKFDIAPQLAREIVYMNDEGNLYAEDPSTRWRRMRQWLAEQVVVWDAPVVQSSEQGGYRKAP